jgi:hypothetical protein
MVPTFLATDAQSVAGNGGSHLKQLAISNNVQGRLVMQRLAKRATAMQNVTKRINLNSQSEVNQ